MINNQMYDVFISYARSDEAQWVLSNLVTPLQNCTTRTKRPSSIFFDEKDIGVGANWRKVLSNALQQSRHFVPVFSSVYFAREECIMELDMALLLLNRENRKNFIKPVLLEQCQLPLYVEIFQGVLANDNNPGWFDQLCQSLEFVPIETWTRVKILDQPGDIQVNRTLAPIRVALAPPEKGKHATITELEIEAENSILRGPTTTQVENGYAEFRDLSLGTTTDAAHLVVSGQGIEPVRTEPFSVWDQVAELDVDHGATDKPVDEPPGSTPVKFPATGRPVLFADGKALAVVADSHVHLFDRDARPLVETPGVKLAVPIRIERHSGSLLALADWEGRLYLIDSSGTVNQRTLCRSTRPLTIAGGLVVQDDDAYVGLWSGEIFRIAPGAEPVMLFHHACGVQALEVADNRVFVANFNGQVVAYEHDRLCYSVQLEPVIRALKRCSRSLMAVGAKKLYQIDLDLPDVLPEDRLPINEVATALVDSKLPVVIDAQGRGLRVDEELNILARFHTVPGAKPTSCDLDGRYCVLANPDGSHTLLARQPNGRSEIVYSHGGALCIDPCGAVLALQKPNGFVLANPAEIVNKGG